MSHFSTIKTQYNNRKVLLESLKHIGLKVTEHEQPVQLNTTWSSQAVAHLIIERSQINSYYFGILKLRSLSLKSHGLL